MSSEVSSSGVTTPTANTSTTTPKFTGNKNTSSNSDEGNGDTSSKVSQIEYVQQLIEECLKLYMDKVTCIQQIIITHPTLQPGFINLMWSRLEQQNPEFFRSYNQLLYLKKQIHLFNTLVTYQARLMQGHNCVFVTSPSSQRSNSLSSMNPQFTSLVANQMSNFQSGMQNSQSTQGQSNQFSSGQSTTSSQPNTPTNFGSTTSPSFTPGMGFPSSFNLQGNSIPNSGMNVPFMGQNTNPFMGQFGGNLMNYQNNTNFFNMQQALANQGLLGNNNQNLFLQMNQGLNQGLTNPQALFQQMVQNQSGFPSSMSPSFNQLSQNVRMQQTKQESTTTTPTDGKNLKSTSKVTTPVNSASDSTSGKSPVVSGQQNQSSPMIQGSHFNPILSSIYGSGPTSTGGPGFLNGNSFGFNQGNFSQNLNGNLLSQYANLNQLVGNSSMVNQNQLSNLKQSSFYDPQQFRALLENTKGFTEEMGEKITGGKNASERVESSHGSSQLYSQGMGNMPLNSQQILQQLLNQGHTGISLGQSVASPQSTSQPQRVQTPTIQSKSSNVSTPVVQTPQSTSVQSQGNWKMNSSTTSNVGGNNTMNNNSVTTNSSSTASTTTSSQSSRKRKSPISSKGSQSSKRRKDEGVSNAPSSTSAPTAPSAPSTKQTVPSIQPNGHPSTEHFVTLQSFQKDTTKVEADSPDILKSNYNRQKSPPARQTFSSPSSRSSLLASTPLQSDSNLSDEPSVFENHIWDDANLFDEYNEDAEDDPCDIPYFDYKL